MSDTTALAAMAVPGSTDVWEALGFASLGNDIPLANGAIRAGADANALVTVGGSAGVVDGVPTAAGEPVAPLAHPNGAVELDHVVVMTNSIDRTSAAIADQLGLPQRRIRETEHVRQAFHRFVDVGATRGCIVEVVERPDVESSFLWGLVVIVNDLDVAVDAADGLVGAPKDAVQRGRRIATVGRAAGLPVAVALMSR